MVAQAEAELPSDPRGRHGPDPKVPDKPSLLPSSEGTGVYSTQASFDKPGFWGVVIEADVQDEGSWTGRTTFEVFDKHRFPWIGEDAPRSENLTAGAPRTPGGSHRLAGP